jgi:hypothetical protein
VRSESEEKLRDVNLGPEATDESGRLNKRVTRRGNVGRYRDAERYRNEVHRESQAIVNLCENTF